MKIPGVEAAEVSLQTATADIRLEPDNRVTMPQLRDVLKRNGYPTRDAQISARGKIVVRDGRRLFDLLNGSTMGLAATPAAARLATDQIVDVAGTSQADGKNAEKLTIKDEELPRPEPARAPKPEHHGRDAARARPAGAMPAPVARPGSTRSAPAAPR